MFRGMVKMTMIPRRHLPRVGLVAVAIIAPLLALSVLWADEPARPAAPPSVPASSTAASEPSEISFSFSDASWEEVARWLADIGKRSLLVEAKPTGTFTYFDKRKYTFGEALDVINSVLITKGFILLLRDNFLILADLKEGIPPHRIDRVDPADLPKKGRTELVKVLLTLKGLVAEEAKKEFESMSSPYGKIIALASTNQLLIVDTARNVEQIVGLIEELEGDQGKADLRAFPLRHVSARDIERVVRDLLGLPTREQERTVANAPQIPSPGGGGRGGDGDGRDRFRSMVQQFMAGQGGGPPGGPPQAGPQSPQRNPNGPFVSVDERTNTIFVAATPDKLALVAQVIQRLDVPQEEGDAVEQTPRIEVYPVTAGDADGLAEVLQSVFDASADLKVTAHPDGRALIIYATPRDHERLKTVLAQIKSEGLRVEVIPLRSLDATTTADLIRALLGQKEEEGGSRFRFSFFDRAGEQGAQSGPLVEADAERNRLVVRGTDSQILEIRGLLVKLGEAGLASDASGLGPGRYRVIPLTGQDPKEVAETVRRLWQRLDPTTPVRVEVLRQQQERESLEPQIKIPDDTTPVPDSNDGSMRRPRQEVFDRALRLVSAEEEEPAPADSKEENPPADAPGEKPGVTIVVGPDNVTLFSDDPKSLDVLENLLTTVVRGEQSSQFAYYYLRVADAQEAALLLDQALYGETRRESFFFIEEEKPNKARILPDTRANALLVVGPPNEQRKVEDLLEVIDRVDPPFSGATPKPYVIPVKYSSAAELADVVRDVFAQQLYDTRSAQQPRINIPNLSFGGFGGSRSRQDQSRDNQRGKLTVGVDEQTNSIIVAAPQEIYKEVEKLVQALDVAAADQGRSARVVTLRNASPDAVEKALGNLFGVRITADLEAEREEKARLRAEEDDERTGQSGRRRNRQRDLEETIRNLGNQNFNPGDFRPRGFFPF